MMLLHACAHNPTGVDLTKEQWKDISEACESMNHFVVFDLAYFLFGLGNPD